MIFIWTSLGLFIHQLVQLTREYRTEMDITSKRDRDYSNLEKRDEYHGE